MAEQLQILKHQIYNEIELQIKNKTITTRTQIENEIQRKSKPKTNKTRYKFVNKDLITYLKTQTKDPFVYNKLELEIKNGKLRSREQINKKIEEENKKENEEHEERLRNGKSTDVL